MVKVCSITNYPKEKETKYNEYFEQFQYPLHIFQKWAIEGIIEGNHVLVTAPTGSGKSLPAEFCLDYFVSKLKKKVIYCSPIKSLSNQKFYDFSQKYPHISVGIITGDIKNNSDADVLIMTTEILLNKLYQIKSNSRETTTNAVKNSSVSFDMDIENELGIVIFDEIHMINDQNRGHVWEQSIMLLPKHIQIVGLSATLDNPERFAYWLENRGETNINTKSNTKEKIVYLTSKKERSVPLTHYSFITVTKGIFKAIKDKSIHEEIKSVINKPFIIQDSKGKFQEEHYFRMQKILKMFEEKDIRVKREHALNQCLTFLTENEMTPAICYVFSIKKLEICAKEVTTNLLEFDSKIPYTIRRECEQIIRKLPNYDEYLHIPEYQNLVSLLEKGIAIHHSKMLPILREIVEILFAKGYIKVLFATESVAIGLNLPVKTTIFTDINKFDGENLRILQAHEYTQAAGRAGRLGIDTVGHVIHLNNLFRNIDSLSYKTMMNGKPQALVSKFKISYNLLLNLIDIGTNNLIDFSNKSMIRDDLDGYLKEIYDDITKVSCELENINVSLKNIRTPLNTVEEYLDLFEKKQNAVNKKRKEIERKIQELTDTYKYIETDKEIVRKRNIKQKILYELENKYKLVEKTISTNVEKVLILLEQKGFIKKEISNEIIQLTLKGSIASHLKEVPCLAFAECMETNKLFLFSSIQLICFLSCFTNINVHDDFKDWKPKTEDSQLKKILENIPLLYAEYQKKEEEYQINTGTEYTFHYDLLYYVEEWTKCGCIEECKIVLQKLELEKEIFLGEFVKALLKINNIACELEKIAELTGNIEFLSKLREIPNLTMKYVVTNQSLYI
jgi:antiviral helicase SKI2